MAHDKVKVERRPALGTPAPVSQEQVDALVRGKVEEKDIAKLLESHVQPEIEEEPRRLKTLSPVRLNKKALLELSVESKTSRKFAMRLEEAAKKDKDTAAEIDDRLERPRARPK